MIYQPWAPKKYPLSCETAILPSSPLCPTEILSYKLKLGQKWSAEEVQLYGYFWIFLAISIFKQIYERLWWFFSSTQILHDQMVSLDF